MKNLDQIIIFSGVNDMFMNNYIAKYDRILGPMFFNDYFKKAMASHSLNWKKKLLQVFSEKPLLSKPLKQKINNKFESIAKIIKRNMHCWSMIKKGKNIKLVYFLQPMANWCKREISDEEQSLFKELDRVHLTDLGYSYISEYIKSKI